MKKACLVLADGTVFEGDSFGAEGETTGEVVFNTSMTGYQEILTDPSYKGQIVTMTYPHIGNYGVNDEDIESKDGPKVEGFIVKECFDSPQVWRSRKSLNDYLKEHGVVGIQSVDTRALTRHIRNRGAQMGIISTEGESPEVLYEKIRKHPGIDGVDMVKHVTTVERFKWEETIWSWEKEGDRSNEAEKKKKLVVYDFGVKFNILRHFVNVGFDLTVVPANTPPEYVLDMAPDGIFLSNGPGDPAAVDYAVAGTKKLLGKKPLFGICLGYQIIGLALGGDTYKLKFGHHGGNHPVKDLSTGKVEITSQNHNYCVDVKSLKGQVELSHINLYDNTEEGMKHVDLPVISVQYHPEAGPGPNDSTNLFQRFKEMVDTF